MSDLNKINMKKIKDSLKEVTKSCLSRAKETLDNVKEDWDFWANPNKTTYSHAKSLKLSGRPVQEQDQVLNQWISNLILTLAKKGYKTSLTSTIFNNEGLKFVNFNFSKPLFYDSVTGRIENHERAFLEKIEVNGSLSFEVKILEEKLEIKLFFDGIISNILLRSEQELKLLKDMSINLGEMLLSCFNNKRKPYSLIKLEKSVEHDSLSEILTSIEEYESDGRIIEKEITTIIKQVRDIKDSFIQDSLLQLLEETKSSKTSNEKKLKILEKTKEIIKRQIAKEDFYEKL